MSGDTRIDRISSPYSPTGLVWKSNAITGESASFYELTGGINYKPHANVVIRPEIRYNWAPGEEAASAAIGDDFNNTVFGITVMLTSTWTEYFIPFDEAYISQQDFGEPQTFDASELVGLQFSLLSGNAGFDIWIDEIRFQPL